MEPPVCRICGKKHWERVCDEAVTEVTKPVTPVTKTVTKAPSVTQTVTPVDKSDPTWVPSTVAPSKLAAALTEIEALRAEVVMLKRKLAEVHAVPTTSTERMRALRARRSKGNAHQG